ncbi:MAG: phosphotransferase enzyme family protein [Ilumatobacteraceae bacterium]
MKDWDELTEAGKHRRLRAVAADALHHYPITPTGLRLIGGFSNVLFRVDTAEGPYALRIDYLDEHTDEQAAIEAAWLTALGETDLDVCHIVPTTSGAPVVQVSGAGVPRDRRCTLFEWVPGRPLGERLPPARYHQLGRLSAGLHRHGAGFTPPTAPMPWDRIFYWPEEVDPIVWDRPENAHHFAGGRRHIVERAIAAVEPAFTRLDPAGAQVIHGDLHPDNVHVLRSRMIALDFEDVTWGHPVQDVAISLFYERDHPDYAELRAAFEQGYRTVADWPVAYDGELEHFMAARTIMFVNYVFNIDHDPAAYLDIALPRLQDFLDRWAP